MTTFTQLRRQAGHTQAEAARYVYCTERTVRRIEAGKEDPARVELYRLKVLLEHGILCKNCRKDIQDEDLQ